MVRYNYKRGVWVIRACCVAVVALGACGAQDAPLISADMISGDAIESALTDSKGDPVRGEEIFSSRESGHCVLCHQVEGLAAEFQGNIGPDLTFVGDRLTAAQLRLRIVDYQIVQPGALMPSYYRIHDLNQVGEAFLGETILSAQDIEDIIAYLLARKADDES